MKFPSILKIMSTTSASKSNLNAKNSSQHKKRTSQRRSSSRRKHSGAYLSQSIVNKSNFYPFEHFPSTQKTSGTSISTYLLDMYPNNEQQQHQLQQQQQYHHQNVNLYRQNSSDNKLNYSYGRSSTPINFTLMPNNQLNYIRVNQHQYQQQQPALQQTQGIYQDQQLHHMVNGGGYGNIGFGIGMMGRDYTPNNYGNFYPILSGKNSNRNANDVLMHGDYTDLLLAKALNVKRKRKV